MIDDIRRAANAAAIEALRSIGGPAAVTDLAQQLGIRTIDGMFNLIDRQIEWKRHSPCAAAEFHRVMYQTMPPIRWIAKLHHRRLWRRWRARCIAAGQAHACQ
jgi:hypothetical protein